MSRYQKNKVIDCGNYYELVIYNRQGFEKARALISKEDYERVKKFRWGMDGNGYINHYYQGRLHKFILGKKKGSVTDHINRNKLDNRRENLRFATASQNAANRKTATASGHTGVYWDKENKKWQALIKKDYQIYWLGRYEKVEDAIKARQKIEKRLYPDLHN